MSGILRTVFFILIIFFMGKTSHAQRINLHLKNARLLDVLNEIFKQSPFSYVIDEPVFRTKSRFSINIRNATVKEVLDSCFKSQEYECVWFGEMLSIRKRTYSFTGKVVNEAGVRLENVTVSVNKKPIYVTDDTGSFYLKNILPSDRLSFSYVGYEYKEIVYDGTPEMEIQLTIMPAELDKAVVSGYQKLPKKEIGSIFRLESTQFRQMSADNILPLIHARIPGLLITQTSGLPGSSYRMQLRGPVSIGVRAGQIPSSEPMFLIDGIPFAASSNSLSSIAPSNAGDLQANNPLVNINPDDIERIEVFKDAEATALYGNRGANGVVLITTKKGKPGKLLLEMKSWSGVGQVTKLPELLNTQQYLDMRRQAFQNINRSYNSVTALDLLVWDTTRYTDYKKLFVGGTAFKHNVQTAFSGGTNNAQYFLSGGYYRENSVFPTDLAFNRKSLHGHLTSTTFKNKLSVDWVSILASSENKSIIKDLTGYMMLPPNMPPLYDPAAPIYGQYPMDLLQQTYSTHIFNSISRLNLKYRLLPALHFSFSLGHNQMQNDESGFLSENFQFPYGIIPTDLQYIFAKNRFTTWVKESQLQYTKQIKYLKITCLMGITEQQVNSRGFSMIVRGDTRDSLQTKNNAILHYNTTNNVYNYIGKFFRLGFRFMDKYLLNATIRRDGSNRIRTADQFGNFGAVGAAWIFRNNYSFKKSVPFINYGKIRASYGICGDDQVAENNYSESWPRSNNSSQSHSEVLPRVADTRYDWQISRKLELGIDLGLLKDRFFVSIAAYRNRTGNQIIGHTDLSTGLNTVTALNAPAVVQNKGMEIWLQFKDDKNGRQLQWYSNVAINLPNNKLLSFPDIAHSSYAHTLVTGKSLSVQQGYRFSGVNRETGLFEMADLNGDGMVNRSGDYKVMGDMDTKLYGSLELGLNHKNWELNIFLEGRVQKGVSLLYQVYSNITPGADMANVPVDFLDRWRKAGDRSNIQRLSARRDFFTMNAISNFLESDARLSSASYIRVKNIYISYKVPVRRAFDKRFKALSFYLSAGNLFTITNYKGGDPETRNLFTLPPLKTLVTGMQLKL